MTPDIMIERMKNGLTMAEIAEMCNKTRSQVAGVIYRYRKEHGIKANRRGKSFEVSQHIGADARGFLATLERNGCRYISGDIRDGSAVYCAGDNEIRGYCKEHHALCYMPIKKRGK